MKKIFLPLFLFASVCVFAEEMKFVTTLSQPVGSFARVEAINADRPAQALQVNFCNNKVSSGSMNVNGAVRAAYLKLDNSGSLGGNVPVYQLKTLNLGSGKDFQGGNVWANEANPAKVKADGTLYGKDMSYLVAELPALQIKDGSSVKANIINSGDGADLEWSAQYSCDYVSTPSTPAEVSRDDLMFLLYDQMDYFVEMTYPSYYPHCGNEGYWAKFTGTTDEPMCWDFYGTSEMWHFDNPNLAGGNDQDFPMQTERPSCPNVPYGNFETYIVNMVKDWSNSESQYYLKKYNAGYPGAYGYANKYITQKKASLFFRCFEGSTQGLGVAVGIRMATYVSNNIPGTVTCKENSSYDSYLLKSK